MTKKAVILLSGGIDSSTTLSIAKAEGFELYALTFDYMQRHRRELKSASMIAEAVGVKKHLIIRFDMSEIGGSALTSDIEVPKTDNTGTAPILRLRPAPSGQSPLQLPSKESAKKDSKTKNLQSAIGNPKSIIPVTYVPARNTIFLSFALAWAEALEASNIFIGANEVDYSGYPDCRPEYLRSFEETANLATKASVEGNLRFNINAPLLYMTKAEIIKKGIALGLDYALTWSCYDPQPLNSKLNFVPCGKCDSCLFRAKGFKEAMVMDPLIL